MMTHLRNLGDVFILGGVRDVSFACQVSQWTFDLDFTRFHFTPLFVVNGMSQLNLISKKSSLFSDER
jgi:hypothetical protein